MVETRQQPDQSPWCLVMINIYILFGFLLTTFALRLESKIFVFQKENQEVFLPGDDGGGSDAWSQWSCVGGTWTRGRSVSQVDGRCAGEDGVSCVPEPCQQGRACCRDNSVCNVVTRGARLWSTCTCIGGGAQPPAGRVIQCSLLQRDAGGNVPAEMERKNENFLRLYFYLLL